MLEDAKKAQADQKAQLLQFLHHQSCLGVNREQNETDAVACCLSLAARDLYGITDNFGSTALVLACRYGMEQLSQVILTTGALSEDLAFMNLHMLHASSSCLEA